VTGKMISPQSIARGLCGRAGRPGGILFRFTIRHSVALVALVGGMVALRPRAGVDDRSRRPGDGGCRGGHVDRAPRVAGLIATILAVVAIVAHSPRPLTIRRRLIMRGEGGRPERAANPRRPRGSLRRCSPPTAS
jgi:hypothetical protein